MPRYQAILFDLFDTLVDLRVEQLPLVTFRGLSHRSTGPLLYQALQQHYPNIPFSQFYEVFFETYQRLDEQRNRTHREILAHERFLQMLMELGIAAPSAAVIDQLVEVHMEQLFRVMSFPAERRTMLDALGSQYRFGIVSNFDHPPTAYRVLEHHKLTGYFDPVVISGEVGWRKPHPAIFRAALDRLKFPPEQVLFVGDTPWADIVGARAVGMPVVWVDRGRKTLDNTCPSPDYIIADVEQLGSALDRG
ncbi:MAG: HAD family hydrolase [Acidobacteriota bacterium]|nr:HAD family hydrolase [Acidobacteriota bacterium]